MSSDNRLSLTVISEDTGNLGSFGSVSDQEVDGSGRNKSPKKSFTFLKKGEGIARFRNPVIKNYENEDEDFFLIKRDHASWNDNQYSKNMNSVENRTFVNMDKQDDGKVNEIEQIDASLKEWDVLSEDELDAETEGLSKEAKQRLNDWFNANMPEKITIDKSKSREQLETGSLQKTLKTKIAQLEQTMNAFSRENRVLLKLMRDNEEAKHRLQEDRTVFEKQRKVELEKFKDWKKRENERLTKENEKLEEKVKQMKSECTNGEYVKQIESLNSRINGLKLEIKQKERSYVMNESKLKTKIVELERENGELKGRAKTLETRRNELASKLNALRSEKTKSEKNSNARAQEVSLPDKKPISSDSSVQKTASLDMILERQLQNGGKEIRLSDGSRTVIDTSGIVITETSEGDRLINYPDGRKEYHTENYRKKIYPNQRTVIEYKDGRIEVQYDEKK